MLMFGDRPLMVLKSFYEYYCLTVVIILVFYIGLAL